MRGNLSGSSETIEKTPAAGLYSPFHEYEHTSYGFVFAVFWKFIGCVAVFVGW